MLTLHAKLLIFHLAALLGKTERLGIQDELAASEFPKTCAGRTPLSGSYEIASKREVQASQGCIIDAKPGTRLTLRAPLQFLGDVHLTGRLEVLAQADMGDDSCFTVVEGRLTLTMELLRMRGCRSFGNGGALRIIGDLSVVGGKLEFEDCRAKQGGAVFVSRSATLTSGAASFTNCAACAIITGSKSKKKLRWCHSLSWGQKNSSGINSGGGLAVQGPLLVQDAEIEFNGCVAPSFGGALAVMGGYRQKGGSMHVSACRSELGGGGMYVGRSFYMDGGTMRVDDCASRRKGGGILLRSSGCSPSSCGISQASLAFRSCSSRLGGGLHLRGALGFMQSNASFVNCSAKSRGKSEGGGLFVDSGSELTAQGGSVRFKHCAAGTYGGGLHHEAAAKVSFDNIDVMFERCAAGKAGGGWDGIGTLTHSRGEMKFQSCKAFRGSAFDTALGAHLDRVKIEMCTGVTGAIESSQGLVAIQQLTFLYGGPSSGFQGEVMAQNLSISEVDCAAVHECVLRANTMRVPTLFCPPGRERSLRRQTELACRLCEPGSFQPLPWQNPHCLPCPERALTCDAVSVTMQAGYMLTVPNLSSVANFRELDAVNRTYFCPNIANCPGGRMAYENQTAMCSKGATGPSCEFAEQPGYVPKFGANPFIKVKCPTSAWAWFTGASYLVGKDVLVFTLAASSVLGAKAGRKDSAVLVNQAMAFGTVASSCLAALAQDEMFAGQAAFLRDLILSWGIAIDVISGQSAAGTPTTCFTMALFGHRRYVTFFWTDLALGVISPLLLVVMLGCMKGFWLGLIVGMNCFLPAFVARISVLLIAFRRARDDPVRFFYTIPDGQLWNYLLKPVVMLAICFTGATCLWLRAVRPDQEPALHVLYLAAPYKPEFAAWEVERLVRKMILSMLCGVFPVTLHPLFQLESVALVLILSAALYYKSRPYTQAKFNETEIGLLWAAIAMTVCTVVCIIPSQSWGTSIPGLKLAGGAAAVVVAMGGTAWMAISMCAAIFEERRKEYVEE